MSLRFDKYGTGRTGLGHYTGDPGALRAGLNRAGATGPGLVTLTGVDHLLHPAGTATNDQVVAPSAVAALRSFLTPYTTTPS